MTTERIGTAGQAPARRPLSVLIADRSPHFRETVRRVLSAIPGCRVDAQVPTLAETVHLARRLQPDLVLLDVDLVLGQSPGRLRRLADAFSDLLVVVMLNEASEQYRQAISERWGYTCIAKDQAETDLETVIGNARAGRAA